jgi:hypothetical protein
MHARLELIRFPAVFFAIVFALAAALSLGAVLGYTLKPSVVESGSPQIVVVREQSGVTPVDIGCIWVDSKKGC